MSLVSPPTPLGERVKTGTSASNAVLRGLASTKRGTARLLAALRTAGGFAVIVAGASARAVTGPAPAVA